jgi:hypothetical protein
LLSSLAPFDPAPLTLVPAAPATGDQHQDIREHLFESMLQKAKAEDREVRGPVDHGFVRSIYFRDPNGYVIELTASTGKHGEMMDPAISKPHEALERWQAAKSD